MRYQLTGSTALSKNSQPRSTRKELLRVDEETGKPYRDYSHHIDKERTPWNKVLVNRNVFDVYKEHIGPGINEYNARQIACGHPERCKTVEGYISQLLQGEQAKNSRKRPRLWNDIIIQCGNMITRINQWFKDNKIKFDSNGYAKTPRKAMSLVEEEGWDYIAEEIWEDCCSVDVKKYGLNADDYKLAETDDEE